jgi:hypothetical protein
VRRAAEREHDGAARQPTSVTRRPDDASPAERRHDARACHLGRRLVLPLHLAPRHALGGVGPAHATDDGDAASAATGGPSADRARSSSARGTAMGGSPATRSSCASTASASRCSTGVTRPLCGRRGAATGYARGMGGDPTVVSVPGMAAVDASIVRAKGGDPSPRKRPGPTRRTERARGTKRHLAEAQPSLLRGPYVGCNDSLARSSLGGRVRLPQVRA